jgi:hypothetical protein
MNTKSKLKSILSFLSSVVTILKWLPFLGKWRPLLIAISTVLGTLSAITCDPPTKPTEPKSPESEPTATPIHTETPSPTPTPKPLPRIIIDKVIHVGKPFSVKYTGEYQNDVSLYVDQYRLGYMGKDLDGTFVLNAVVLNTAGSRRINLRNIDDQIIAEQIVEVN